MGVAPSEPIMPFNPIELIMPFARSQLKAGDHIYTWRTAYAYSHHGIYVGENMVIHFTNPEKADSGPVRISSVLSSSSTSHSACLNSHNSGSSLSTCSHCTSWNPNIPASCLRLPHCGYRQPDSGVIISCLNCFLGSDSLCHYQYGVGESTFKSKFRGGTCTTAKSDPPEEVIKRAVYLLYHGFGRYDVLDNNCEHFALYCKTGLVITLIHVFRLLGTGQANIFGVVDSNIRYRLDIGVRTDVEKVPVEQVVEFLWNRC